jgi:hypothetical protein
MDGFDFGSGLGYSSKHLAQIEKLVKKGWEREVAELLPPFPGWFCELATSRQWWWLYRFFQEVNKLPEEQRWDIVMQLGGDNRE